MTKEIELQAPVPWWVYDACEDSTPMRTLFCVGGIGAAKSYGSQVWDIYRALQNGVPLSDPKRSISWTVAPNYRICDTLIDLTFQVADGVFGMQEGKHFAFKKAYPRAVDFRQSGRNHQIQFLSAANPEHFVSASITHCRWSEVGVSKPEVFEKLHDRLRDKRGKVLQLLCDGSPEGYNHFFEWAGFIGTRREAVDETRNFRVFRVETGDNVKNLAPGYLESQRARYAYSPALLDSYERGIFTNFRQSNAAYFSFTQSKNLAFPAPELSPQLTIDLGWDFNVSPLAWVAAQTHTFQKDYYSPRLKKTIAVRESSGESRGLYDACLEFAVWFPKERFRATPIRIHGDSSGWARSHKVDSDDYTVIEEYLRTLGYVNIEVVAPRSNPNLLTRLEKTNALFAYDMAAVSSPECRSLIDSLNNTTLKEGVWKIDKPAGDKVTHFADAFSYLLMGLYGDVEITNPHGTSRPLGASM